MVFKTFNSPLSFAHRVTLLIFILIVFSSRLSQVMATKTGNADKSITFISSELDWSKDLDGIKPYGPSANAANMDPNFGYQAYRTPRFKIIRKMILRRLLCAVQSEIFVRGELPYIQYE